MTTFLPFRTEGQLLDIGDLFGSDIAKENTPSC